MALTTITNPMVAVNAIQGTLIADNAITAVHIATNAVSGTLIADNAVTAVHIAQNTITVTQIADDAIEAAKIADGVITTNHLNKAMISSQTEVTAVGGDYVLIGDTSDSNNLKKALVSDFGETNRLPLAGGTMTGDLILNDGVKLELGSASGGDLQIYHDGSDSYITDTGTGNLLIQYSDLYFSKDGGSTHSVVFRSTGNVGIGVTGPDNILSIHQPDANSHAYVHITQQDGGSTSSDGLSIGIEDGGVNAVIRNRENGYLRMYTNNTERMRITSAGLIGMGDSPSNLTSEIITITTPASGGGQGIAIKRLDSNSDQTVGQIRFSNNSTDDLAFIKVTTDGAVTSSRMRFFTNTGSGSTERMKILSDGEIVSGPSAINDTYSPLVNGITSDALVAGRHATSGSLGIWRTNTMEFKVYHNGQGYIMTWGSNGVISGDFNDTSDVNLKENISTIADGTTVINSLRPVKFDWKDAKKGNNQHGFIAQEVEKVLPDAVEGNDYVENETGLPDDEPAGNGKNMNSNAVLAHAVKAIQELEARIKVLEG